jgi:hypothetical protein
MPPPDGFGAFVDGALLALAREAAATYARLATLVGAEGVRLAMGDAALVVRFGARSHAIEPARAPAAVEARSDRATIAALLAAELTSREAIESDRLQLRGEVDAVLRFEQALGAFVEGAARAPSFPGLLAAFRDER